MTATTHTLRPLPADLAQLLRASLGPRESWAYAWHLARKGFAPGLYATDAFRALWREATKLLVHRERPYIFDRLEDFGVRYRLRLRAKRLRPAGAPAVRVGVLTERCEECDMRAQLCRCGGGR